MAAVAKIPEKPSVTCGASVSVYPNKTVRAVAANASASAADPRLFAGPDFSAISLIDTPDPPFCVLSAPFALPNWLGNCTPLGHSQVGAGILKQNTTGAVSMCTEY